jgi:hypothetical protein
MASLVLFWKGREVAVGVAVHHDVGGGQASTLLEAALLEERKKTAGIDPEKAFRRAVTRVEMNLELAGTDRTPQGDNLNQEALLSGTRLRPDGQLV